MAKGIMGSAMAMPGGMAEEEEQGGAPKSDGYSDSEDRKLAPGEADPDTDPQAAQAAAQPDGEGGGEPGDDEAVDRVMAAAVMAMKSPQYQQSLAQAAAGEQPGKALAELARGLIDELDNKSGASIPEDALLEAGITIYTTMADVGGLDARETVEGMKQIMVTAMQAQGANPQQIAQALDRVDIAGMVDKASAQIGKGGGKKPAADDQETA